jgi:hypothetical protein
MCAIENVLLMRSDYGLTEKFPVAQSMSFLNKFFRINTSKKTDCVSSPLLVSIFHCGLFHHLSGDLAVGEGTEMSVHAPYVVSRLFHKVCRGSCIILLPILELQIEPISRFMGYGPSGDGPSGDGQRMQMQFRWKSHNHAPSRGIGNSVTAGRVRQRIAKFD